MKRFAILLLAASPALLYAQTDNFDDGNDAGWTRYDPIGSHPQLPDIATFSFPNGGYRIQTSPSPAPGSVGPGRAGSLRNDVTYTDFYITVDIVNWDPSLDQAFGILARCKEVGLGSTDGYAMTWDKDGSDLDITAFGNEDPNTPNGHGVSVSGNDRATLVPGKSYRMVFMGVGAQLTAEIYELPNLTTPLASITGSDTTYSSGVCGLIVYDNTSAGTGTTDATFDNYFALSFKPPRLHIEALPFDDMRVSWPAEPPNYVLQATTTLGTGWVDITENIEEFGGIRSFTDNAFLQERRFYRLRP
ncbi:MAG TPA: hypothetical protein VJ063_07710 [Verrucomicrobiae bacterium]|nr:hypothetical protein [Verrucomicrobiae bacterium]